MRNATGRYEARRVWVSGWQKLDEAVSTVHQERIEASILAYTRTRLIIHQTEPKHSHHLFTRREIYIGYPWLLRRFSIMYIVQTPRQSTVYWTTIGFLVGLNARSYVTRLTGYCLVHAVPRLSCDHGIGTSCSTQHDGRSTLLNHQQPLFVHRTSWLSWHLLPMSKSLSILVLSFSSPEMRVSSYSRI